MRTLPLLICLAGLALWTSCDSEDDDSNDASSKQALVFQTDWTLGSDPGLNSEPRGRLNWFMLREMIRQQEIQPEGPFHDNLLVLALAHQPFAFLAGSTTHYNPASWTSLSSRAALDTLATVLEWKMLFVEVPDEGTLVIDIGEFSEDVVPNGALDTEDTNLDQVLQTYEDVGLDLNAQAEMPWPLPVDRMGWTGGNDEMMATWGVAYDWQDLNGDGIRQASEPWSWDDWSAADEVDPFAGNPCGWEGNSRDWDFNVPDTEDVNGSTNLDTADNFYRYILPIDPAAPTQDTAITQLDNSEWLQLSLQLARGDRQTFGTPNLGRPVRVRVSLYGFNGPTLLHFTWFDWR